MSIPPPEPDLSQEQIVRRTEDMAAVLRERQEECEELGRLPDQTSQDFIDAGFYRILQPRRFGGYEFEETLRTRKTTLLPSIPMKEHPDYHRFYGEAVQLIDVAEGALLRK